MTSCITTYPIQSSSEAVISSPKLLAVGERKRSGLILCKDHYAEFAGPGAAICNPFEINYTKIIAIGSPEITEISTYEARQQAYGRRIQWVRWLQRIVAEPNATQRAEKLFAGFEEFFGSEVLIGIPNDVLALLAGVLPHTITLLRSQHQDIDRGNGHTPLFAPAWTDVKVMTLDNSNKTAVSEAFKTAPASKNSLLAGFGSLPCSA